MSDQAALEHSFVESKKNTFWTRLTTKRSFRLHVFGQIKWLLLEGFILLFSMGFGLKWVMMLTRTVLFGMFQLNAIMRLIWWYLNSPFIMRRVRYSRSMVEEVPITLGDTTMGSFVSAAFSPMRPMSPGGSFAAAEDPAASASAISPGQVVKKVKSENNRAFMDLHYPTPIEELLLHASKLRGSRNHHHCALSGEGTQAAKAVGMTMRVPLSRSGIVSPSRGTSPMASASRFHPNTPKKEIRFPVVIAVTGGAWIIGSHFWFSMLARVLSAAGFLVVTPDYRNFPSAKVPEMVNDVSDAIDWVVKNIADYHGDPEHIYVVGQSAGGHLSMMALAKAAEAHGNYAKEVERLGGEAAARRARVRKPSIFHPQKDIRAFVGLSGVYNFPATKGVMTSRGLPARVVDIMADGDLVKASAFHFVRDHLCEEVIATCMPKTLAFLHGNKDMSAPLSESAEFVELIQSKMLAFLSKQHRSSSSAENTPSPSRRRLPLSGEEEEDEFFSQSSSTNSFAHRFVPQPINVEASLHVIHGGTHTSPMVEDALSGYSPLTDAMCALHNSIIAREEEQRHCCEEREEEEGELGHNDDTQPSALRARRPGQVEGRTPQQQQQKLVLDPLSTAPLTKSTTTEPVETNPRAALDKVMDANLSGKGRNVEYKAFVRPWQRTMAGLVSGF